METMLVKPNNWSKSNKSSQQSQIFVNVEGNEDIICFRNVIEYMINEKIQHWKKAGWVVQQNSHTMKF